MTSNAIVLPRRITELVDAGLTHLNISLDTLDPLRFELITRRRGHDAVLSTLKLATANPKLQAVKLNVVIMKGVNEDEVLEFVELTKTSRVSVRFIEVYSST